MVKVTLLQAPHFSSVFFVLEPLSQRACKIDELVHGLLLRGQSGGSVEFLLGDTARLNKVCTHTYEIITDRFTVAVLSKLLYRDVSSTVKDTDVGTNTLKEAGAI